MAGIFISYRRQESTKDARSLYERLRGEFGREGVFIDLEGLDYGVDFVESLGRQLEGCQVLLALIGPHWLTAKDARGRRRIDDENDFVRIEVRTALDRGIRVVPVLIDGAPMPVTEELPADLQRLVRLQALELDFKRFDQDVGRLVSVIGKLLGKGVQPRPLMQTPPPPSGHWKTAAIVLGVVAAGAGGYALKPGPAPAPVAGTAIAQVPAPVPAPPVPKPDAYPPGKRFRDCEADTCPWLVVIPAGKFLMGSPANEEGRSDDEGPQHEVTIAKPLAVMEAEVTRGQFAAFVSATGHKASGGCYGFMGTEWKLDEAKNWRSPGFDQKDEHPAVCVSWDDAQAYTKWLSGKTGQGYRLLSEAEWEYAARAKTQTRYSFGDKVEDLCAYANVADRTAKTKINFTSIAECTDGFVYTAPVKTYNKNSFGLFDLHGNAWEWVQDCWHGDYNGAPVTGVSWETNCKEGRRVLHGGGWGDFPSVARSAYRYRSTPGYRNDSTGFRLARTLTP